MAIKVAKRFSIKITIVFHSHYPRLLPQTANNKNRMYPITFKECDWVENEEYDLPFEWKIKKECTIKIDYMDQVDINSYTTIIQQLIIANNCSDKPNNYPQLTYIMCKK